MKTEIVKNWGRRPEEDHVFDVLIGIQIEAKTLGHVHSDINVVVSDDRDMPEITKSWQKIMTNIGSCAV